MSCALLLMAPMVQAQLQVPGVANLPGAARVPLPSLPTDTVTRQLDTVIIDASSDINSQAQRLLRAAQVRELLRTHADVLEADPNGAPIMRRQLIAISPSDAALQAAFTVGFSVIQEQAMSELAVRVVTLQAPLGMSTRRALQRLRELDRAGSYDYNPIYMQSGAMQSGVVDGGSLTPPSVIAQANASAAMPHSKVRIGLIDAGVAIAHPAFRGDTLHTWGCESALPSAHGTAVASLLVGQDHAFAGAAPMATLYAADVYCGQPVGGAMTRIAAAMAWLAQQQVPVINISLVGPDNALLKQLVHSLIARGHLIVAAVGNDGPAAPPLYPAAYPEVVGVTAVDGKGRVLVEAERGPQVMFAAPGADMAAAVLNDAYAEVRGTSFAAPLVAGLLAADMQTPQPDAAQQAIAKLAEQARPLGAARMNTTYGHGVVAESLRVTLRDLPVADRLHEGKAQSAQ